MIVNMIIYFEMAYCVMLPCLRVSFAFNCDSLKAYSGSCFQRNLIILGWNVLLVIPPASWVLSMPDDR